MRLTAERTDAVDRGEEPCGKIAERNHAAKSQKYEREYEMVKTERLDWIIEFLTSQMNHWIFFPLIMTATGVAMQLAGLPIEGAPDFLLWTVCGLFPIVCFLIRNFVERFWIFVLCHGVVLTAVIFCTGPVDLAGTIVCVICAAAYILYSFALRLKENTDVYSGTIHPVTALVLSAGTNYLFHKQENMPDWDRYYFFILIGVFACYLVIYYLKHYLNFLMVNKSSAGYLPAREILHSGIGFVLPYTLIGVLILALSLNVEWLEPILRVIKAILRPILVFLIGLLPDGSESPEGLNPMENVQSNNGGPGLPKGESFWLWEILEYVAVILFFCGCIYALIKALKWFIRYIRGISVHKTEIVTGQADVFDVREKCAIEKKRSGSRGAGLFQRFAPVERIRKLYKKRVLSGKIETEDREALNYKTARECGKLLSLPDMAEIYEQARYSGREITADDVRRMKLACGGQASRD